MLFVFFFQKAARRRPPAPLAVIPSIPTKTTTTSMTNPSSIWRWKSTPSTLVVPPPTVRRRLPKKTKHIHLRPIAPSSSAETLCPITKRPIRSRRRPITAEIRPHLTCWIISLLIESKARIFPRFPSLRRSETMTKTRRHLRPQ